MVKKKRNTKEKKVIVNKINMKTIIIVIISLIILCAITLLLINVLKPKKSYNTEAIRTEMINYYDNLRLMDFVDLTQLFGLDLSDTDNSVFMSNIELEKPVTSDTIMIIVINTNNTEYYYDIFKSFVDSYKLNTDDMDMLNYYDKVKLVQGDGYIYLLMGEDTVMLEKEINSFYN